jgi:hypothetical protein
MKKYFVSIFLVFAFSSAAYSLIDNPRKAEITNFFTGHYHQAEETIGAPSHSGRTDRYGCHNRSVPYHCH